MSQVRRILHVDMDAFFASVEQRENPDLRGKPVVVGGSRDGRGVVAAASYEARRFGIRSAMPSRRAAKLCPEAVFVKPRFPLYQEVSRRVMEIFRRYTDLVEPLSLDEAFLDVTVSKTDLPFARDIARKIKEDILAETFLTASAGVAPNKFLAKIASGYRKPDGLTVIAPEKVELFLSTLPVREFPGVGPATEKRLHDLGIYAAPDLRSHPEAFLREHFGKFGSWLYRVSRGLDDRPVNASRERKSLGAETTFRDDVKGHTQIVAHLERIASVVAERLLARELSGSTITLKVKFSNFEVVTRAASTRIRISTARELLDVVVPLLEKTEVVKGRSVRLVGIQVSNFNEKPPVLYEQLELNFP